MILATSPTRANYKEFEKEGGGLGTKYYMPIWDDEELELCRTLHEARWGSAIMPDSVKELVEIAGRIPRYLFDIPAGKDPKTWNEAEIANALRSKSAEYMLAAAGNITGDESKISHRILALDVSADYELVGLKFHSGYIRDRLYQYVSCLAKIPHEN